MHSIFSEEKWKDVQGYEGLYQISNLGRVKRNGTILHQSLNTYGYCQVSLCNNGDIKNHLVHRLVANEFLPNPERHPQVNHIDGNKKNNAVTNLEWCTQAENNNHAIRTGLRKFKSVEMYEIGGGLVKTFHSRVEIDAFFGRKLCQDVITRCCNGKRKTAYGHQWKYKTEV